MAHLLSLLYRRCAGRGQAPPSKSTIWRVLAGVDPVAVDAAFGAWLARGDQAAAAVGEAESPTLPLVAADGKAVRGARVGEGEAPRLLAAAAPGGVVLAPAQVATKSNEIPGFATLLNTIDIAGKVVVADALRT